jgi:heptosyltransferase I
MKILIVKTSSLGDIVHAFPILPYLKAKFPEAQIDWVVEKPYAELARAHPLINQVFAIQTKRWRAAPFSRASWCEVKSFWKEVRREAYDVIFDLQGNLKSGIVTGMVKSANKVGFGSTSAPEWLNTLFTNRRFNPRPGQNIRADYQSLVQSYYGDSLALHHPLVENPHLDRAKAPELSDRIKSAIEEGSVALRVSEADQKAIEQILLAPEIQQGMKVMVCPGSAWLNKQVSVECLIDFLSEMTAYYRGCYLLAWGSAEEKVTAQMLHEHFPSNSLVMEKVSLAALQNLMGHVDLVVAMDSLPLHLAATTNTPTFSVFGASSSIKYKPEGERHLTFQGACPYGRTFVKRCPILRTCPTGACIKDIKGKMLIQVIKSKGFI